MSQDLFAVSWRMFPCRTVQNPSAKRLPNSASSRKSYRDPRRSIVKYALKLAFVLETDSGRVQILYDLAVDLARCKYSQT
jgi:hypothetical protein